MGEEDVIARFMRETDKYLEVRERYRDVVTDLIEAVTKHHLAMESPTAEPRLQERNDWFLRIVELSIRYAHACSKSHDSSGGMRMKVRQELREAMKQWCELRGPYG